MIGDVIVSGTIATDKRHSVKKLKLVTDREVIDIKEHLVCCYYYNQLIDSDFKTDKPYSDIWWVVEYHMLYMIVAVFMY